jgi:hypothetical protein
MFSTTMVDLKLLKIATRKVRKVIVWLIKEQSMRNGMFRFMQEG